MKRIVECVPNFSEGRDPEVISQIAEAIGSVEGVRLLNIDPGKATNRTVMTFAGEPDDVVEAAFRGAAKAAEVIDMASHTGEHPRFGAMDVCPLVPVSGISMEETVGYARKLAERVGDELGIHVYCYGYAAFTEKRKDLAYCRSGEYEGLKAKLEKPEWKPDFGPVKFNKRSGASAVGARDFLIAYNVNLNTTSVRRANAIAFDIRERGRVKREGNGLTGKIIRDEKGNPVYIPGSLKAVKAIGWYIEEFGIAQISINLTDMNTTPLHIAFDEACKRADARGLRVTGSEIVGLVPLKSMLDAGRYFLKKQKRSAGLPEEELIRIAIKSLGLNELYEFKPEEKIIEYALAGTNRNLLINMSLKAFANETASESPAPGGGSAAAYMATLGIALANMVANLSSHKRGWDDRWEEFSGWAEKGMSLQNELLTMVDKDTKAFRHILDAFGMPKSTPNETETRDKAIEEATKYAIQIPYKVMETGLKAMEIIKAMVLTGNPNSVSDAGVGALAVRSGVLGAFLNVKTNAAGLKDKSFKTGILKKSEKIAEKVRKSEQEILDIIKGRL
ncbi:MAG: glutamate formimidoyltransferase [Bacteroidales bacterium]|nr:glutamate formimidoyltransferase [Bacteroidales bacterium]